MREHPERLDNAALAGPDGTPSTDPRKMISGCHKFGQSQPGRRTRDDGAGPRSKHSVRPPKYPTIAALAAVRPPRLPNHQKSDNRHKHCKSADDICAARTRWRPRSFHNGNGPAARSIGGLLSKMGVMAGLHIQVAGNANRGRFPLL